MRKDMSPGYRVMLALAIIIIVLILTAFIGYLSGRWDVEAQSLPPATLSKYERQLIDLDRQAISMAYRDQIRDLFRIWGKDGHDQPRRAVTGSRQARRMFDQAMAAIDEREERWKDAGGK
jgi:hypothetical protein